MSTIIRQEIGKRINQILKKNDITIAPMCNSSLVDTCYQDLQAFSEKDPSSKNDMIYIFKYYKSYHAVLYYRVANYIYKSGDINAARQLSEYSKTKTGIEIHPSAQIGIRFILDHGIGTVIGETAIIGNDCYILQNVVLGSSHISNNNSGARHPIIGNNVEIGSFVRIYGRVEIGDNVKISPGAIIKQSIPKDSKVIVNSNYQVLRASENLNVFFLGYFHNKNNLILFFDGESLKQFKSIEVLINNRKIDHIRIKEKFILCSNLESYEGEIVLLFNKRHEIRIWVNQRRRDEGYDNKRIL